MIDYSEDRRIIKQAIDDNKLVVFVGAGASMESGIPSWKEAIEKIYEKIKPTSLAKDEALKIPQIYFNHRGGKEYTETIKEIFKYDDKETNKIHDLIIKLKPCHVITTNYDDLLEKAFVNNGEFLDVVQKDTDIPFCKNSRMIVKMHGGFTHNNFVLKEDDYLNYSRNFTLIETYIKALLAKNLILFVGYSFNDPDTKQIFNWVKSILGDNFQRAYYLDASNNYDFHTINYYKNFGINVIYLSVLEKNSFNEKAVFDNTIRLLEFIINDEEEKDLVYKIYQASRHLKDLNYILADYVADILSEIDVWYKENNLILLNDKAKELFIKLNAEQGALESEQHIAIKKMLNKTIIKKAYIHKESQQRRIWCNFENDQVEKIYEDISTQNLTSIKEYLDSLNMLEDINNQQQLLIAYIYYELQEYKKCYVILKKLSLS